MQYAAMPALPPQLISGLNGIIQGLDSSVGGVQTLPLQLSPLRNYCAEPCNACGILAAVGNISLPRSSRWEGSIKHVTFCMRRVALRPRGGGCRARLMT